jgi:ribulose-bisphosphate carboxylase large chain
MPVASGGLEPGMVESVVKYLGQDVIINFGGGILGHPDGRIAGARAARQAVVGISQGKKKAAIARENKEFARALEYWGK